MNYHRADISTDLNEWVFESMQVCQRILLSEYLVVWWVCNALLIAKPFESAKC